MLNQERDHLHKCHKFAYPGSQSSQTFVLPGEKLVKLRNETVDQMIFKIGHNLKQSLFTIHLAVKIFDIAFVYQQEYTDSFDEAIGRTVRVSLAQDPEASKDEEVKK